jgi:hypothetical protein
MSDSLQRLLPDLGLPRDAVDWLVMLYDMTQVFDDVADGDAPTRADLDKCIWSALVGQYCNPFFQAHHASLLPGVATMILKWQASDRVEREGKPCAMSYAWRAGYYDVVLLVCQICFGVVRATELSATVMRLYGERFEDYQREFNFHA